MNEVYVGEQALVWSESREETLSYLASINPTGSSTLKAPP